MSECLEAQLSTFLTQTSSPAHGLPVNAYTDAAFWQLECETVLSQYWVFAGFAHELSQPGDTLPVMVAGKPIILLRNTEGNIAAFHNACRHRCLLLIDQPKNVGKLIRCPYHAWAYDLNGGLRASPHFGGINNTRPEGFDPTKHGLIPVRSAVWHDWIFVNISGTAPAFEDYAAPLVQRLEGIDFAKVELIGLLDFGEIATNWKFIMENFIEPYHVQFVHSSTTSQPLSDHYTIIDDVCLGSAVELDQELGTDGNLGVSSRYLTLFPNFILGRYFPDQLGVYLNIPLGAGRTIQKRAIYTTTGKQLSATEVEGLKNLWCDVHREDHHICERLQLGRASPVATAGGVLSPQWEDSVRAFQVLLANACSNRATPI